MTEIERVRRCRRSRSANAGQRRYLLFVQGRHSGSGGRIRWGRS